MLLFYKKIVLILYEGNRMKKRVIIILIAIIGTFLVFNLGLYSLLFSNQATTPDSIARKVGLKLPADQITKADDNIDRKPFLQDRHRQKYRHHRQFH